MKHLLFSILLAGTIAAVQTAEAQCTNLPKVDADVQGDHVLLSFYGQSAKDIFNGMPESSKHASNTCYGLNRVIKIKGGFVCIFATDADDPTCAHRCYVDISSKTGKTVVRKKNDVCDEPNP